MREKELRLALVCYGGISLAVYMHGITKEIWRLARASRDFHVSADGPPDAYRRLLETIQAESGTRLRVFSDIVAGASAGGINGIFLAQAVASGQSLEPLTDLWLDCADVDKLIDPDARPWSRFAKFWMTPLLWWWAGGRGGTIERTVDRGTRAEVRAKLSSLVRGRWFRPPFDGPGFTHLLLDALDAMAGSAPGPALLPPGHPLDLFVTVTDFRGHPEKLRLNSPPEVMETEHRLVLGFAERGEGLGDSAGLAFAARATASFPGAFPPFTVRELDEVLIEREREWPDRGAFLKRAMPRRAARGEAETALLIDGSVLANAPFRPAIAALKNRPARREIDRRFVYIDPKPGGPSIGFGAAGEARAPGFIATILGALSDLPRTQPIRDNLEAIEGRSERIRAMRAIVDALRPEVEQSIEDLFGGTLFLNRPSAARLASWRAKAQERASRSAGHAYAAYAHLKLAGVADDTARILDALSSKRGSAARRTVQDGVRRALRETGLDRINAGKNGASPALIGFFRAHDLAFRIRRLRLMARRLGDLDHEADASSPALDAMRATLYESLALYLDRERRDFFEPEMNAIASAADAAPLEALLALAAARDLPGVDLQVEERLAAALAALPKAERRAMLLAYLGFPFYDIATLALLQGEGLDEFDAIKVDRISPDDARALRDGGAEATLKGIQFNSFGAFFSRAFRENDYLWGRLHGAERLIDIVLSSAPAEPALPEGLAESIKAEAFHAILDEEEPRLRAIPNLFEELRRELAKPAVPA